MMNSRAGVRPFDAHVLIGNWYEDRMMEEVKLVFFYLFFSKIFCFFYSQEVLKDFLHKRNTGQLASQQLTEVERMSQSVRFLFKKDSKKKAKPL